MDFKKYLGEILFVIGVSLIIFNLPDLLFWGELEYIWHGGKLKLLITTGSVLVIIGLFVIKNKNKHA